MKKINKNCAKFLAQASHDLRQPLQTLMIYIDLFDTSRLSSKQRNLWEKIVNATENLNFLLGSILDFSKLEFCNIKVKKQTLNLKTLLENLFKEYEILAKVKKIDFTYNLCSATVISDPVLIERILRNLLSNAFKFTTNKVRIVCEIDDDNVKIAVSDNGKGIKQEEQKNIFNEYYQGQYESGFNKGVGLGLAIVKKLTAKLNADIEVQSSLGIGSKFTLILNKETKDC